MHITTTANKTAKEDLQGLVSILFNETGDETDKRPRNFWHCYFNQHARTVLPPLDQVPNLAIGPEVDSSLTIDSAFANAEAIFRKLYPDDEFIPTVPHPEDVIFV